MLNIKHSNVWLLVCSSIFLFAFNVSCESDQPDPGPTLHETLSALPNASMYLEAIDIAEFDDDLKSGQSLTLFVPTNDAFETFLSQNGLGSLNDVPLEDLRNLLRYHILPIGVELSALASNYTLTAANNSPDGDLLALFVILGQGNNPTRLNGNTQVLNQDRNSGNSFYNIIDRVMPLPTILSILRDNELFSGFADGVLQTQGLADSLENNGPYTLLTAINSSLEETLMARYGIDDLLSLESTRLDTLMKYHVLKGNLTANDFQNSITLNYETLVPDETVNITGFSSLYVNDSSQVVLANIQTTNGIVHVMDKILNR